MTMRVGWAQVFITLPYQDWVAVQGSLQGREPDQQTTADDCSQGEDLSNLCYARNLFDCLLDNGLSDTQSYEE
jgi:hypothetical protein